MDRDETTISERNLALAERYRKIAPVYEWYLEAQAQRPLDMGGDQAPSPAAAGDDRRIDNAIAGIDEPSSRDDADEDDEDENEDDIDDDFDEDQEDWEEGGQGGAMDYSEAYRDSGFGGVPATTVAIADLIKMCKYYETEGGEGGDNDARREAARGCMICIEDFEADVELGVMPCSHMFHHGCLVEWLSRSCLCPCCRHALPSEAQH
ncbi:hypothetical protein BRADI_4g42643v3, partial [Brachypodium distachyon]